MTKSRLEAFSDGVIAILITIMVLEFKVPAGADWAALRPIAPVALAYALSFVYLGIYWNNHHHLFHAAHRVDGTIMWANLHLLFWLSLVPFGTAWMGESHLAPTPTLVYGVVLLGAAIAYTILLRRILASEGTDSPLAREVGRDWKGNASLALYLVAIGASFKVPELSAVLFLLVACIWLVPDPRMERTISH